MLKQQRYYNQKDGLELGIMNNQSWFSNEESLKLGSPMTNRQLKTCLSFASIKQHKAIHELETPRHSATKIGLISRTGEKQNRQTIKNTKQKQKLKEREKKKRQEYCNMAYGNGQNERMILETYQLQNQSLKSTVVVLKQQVQALNNSYQILKKQNHKIKQQQMQTNEKLQKATEKVKQCQQKQKQYLEIMPKIQELQELQDRMIQQNARLKERQNLLKSLLAEILIMAGSNSDNSAIQIRNLINCKLNKL